ncbi:hypothetical protein DFH06DRAFT_310902 [Mycena polygramma]|nr:hypothetical protein DFH06DRAFT_310902 [Mycena polygramma]
MPRALTAEEEEYAQKAAQDWFRYERATEAHASVLRKEPARFMEEFAKQDPATLSGPLPPKPELDGVVASYEASLAKECTTFEEHLEVLNASLFLARVLQTDLAEKSRDVFLQVSRLRTQMDKADPLVADPADPADQLRLLASLPGWELGPGPSQPSRDEDDPSANFPEYMPTPDLLDWDALSELPRVAVTAAQIAHWKANPEPLLNGDGSRRRSASIRSAISGRGRRRTGCSTCNRPTKMKPSHTPVTFSSRCWRGRSA